MKRYLKLVFCCVWLQLFQYAHILACPNITVSYSISQVNSCVPRGIIISNNSSGTKASTATYRLYINGNLAQTKVGTGSFNATLSARGTYSIMIKSTDTSGCVDSLKSTYAVTKLKPKYLDQVNVYTDAPEWINCIQLSTDSDSLNITTSTVDSLNALKVVWGDGQTTTFTGKVARNTTLSHSYVATGVFDVSFFYTDTFGCADTVFGKVVNERVPTAGIIGPNSGFNLGCVPFEIAFKNNSSNISNGTRFTWNFGDGSSQVLGSATFNDAIKHNYTRTLCNGTVQLTAGNVCGYSQTTWNPLQISNKDRAIFSIDSTNCDTAGNYYFQNFSSDSFCLVPDLKEYLWDYGDGTNSGWITGKSTQAHKYTNQGLHTVCLLAKNKCGIDTTCLPIRIMYTPIVGFVIDTTAGCSPLKVTVTDTSVGFGITRIWDFGDGSTGTAKTMSHTYTKAGTYTLKLTVSNRCGTRQITKTITVFQAPRANFSGANTGCLVHSVTLSNNSVTDFPTSIQYFWKLGNGSTSTLANPSKFTYTDTGTYKISLRIVDVCGSDSISKFVRVDYYPTIDVEHDTLVCATDSVTFINKSSDYSSFIVNFGDGSAHKTYLSNSTFRHVYTNQGTYTVTFIAVNNGICSTFKSTKVRIKSNAKAAISVNKLIVCAPFAFIATNKSQFANRYSWYLDDSLISTNFNPPNVLVTKDTTILKLKLIAVDTINCHPDSVQVNLVTSKDPIASLAKPYDSACGPFSTSHTNLSTFSKHYLWNFGNGLTSTAIHPTTTYKAARFQDTFYTISLVAYNWLGCADTAYGIRKIFPKPKSNFNATRYNGCGPLIVDFTNFSTPYDTGNISMMGFIWNMGNGKTVLNAAPPQTTYLASKTQDSVYLVRLIAFSEHGCMDTLTKQIRVYPNPTVIFKPDTINGCGPLFVNLNNQSTPNDTGSIQAMTFNWQLGNGKSSSKIQASNTYISSISKDTNYVIKLLGLSEHGCIDSASVSVRVYPKPVASFVTNLDAGCAPLSVQFTNNSIPKDTGSINIMNFKWNFGNGTNGTNRNDTVIYAESTFKDTIYNVKLIAISEHQCADTLNHLVTVHPTPTAVFGANKTSGCGPLPVIFTNLSSISDSNFWDMGSGFSYSTVNNARMFPYIKLQDTTYFVSLFTKTKFGCKSDTLKMPIIVFAQPIASYFVLDDSICPRDSLKAINTSQGATSQLWNAGDSGISTLFNLTYRYKMDVNPFAMINRKISQIAISKNNCRDTAKSNLIVLPYSTAQIGNLLDSVCSPITIQYVNNSVNSIKSTWMFDDGTTSQLLTPKHYYSNISNLVRTKTTILKVENTFGCTHLDTAIFALKPEPVAMFAPFRLSLCDSGYHRLDNSSQNNDTNYWDFGDGQKSMEKEPLHLFKRSKTQDTVYAQKLRIVNKYGCMDTAYGQLRMNPTFSVAFDTMALPLVCQKDVVVFKNLSKNTVYYSWSFGDTSQSNDKNPVHLYKYGGRYVVKLIAYDKNSCSDSMSATNMINILPRPKADFTFNPPFSKMPNSKVDFTEKSLPRTGLTFAWDFDDNAATSLNANPSHVFSDSGLYRVRLIVDNGECIDSIRKPIYVEPPLPTIDFIISDTAGCGPFKVDFTAFSKDANRYRWLFDDGHESRDSLATNTFKYQGRYDITLIAYGPGGSKDTTKVASVRVHPNPVANFHISPTDRYLPNATFTTINESVNAANFLWELRHDDAPLAVQQSGHENITFELNEPGRYAVQLIAIDTHGCTDTMLKPSYLLVHDSGRVFISTAFTPSSSLGLNDTYKPVLSAVSDNNYLFTIYNRWGEKIFETDNPNTGWDGRFNGIISPPGLYLFRLNGQYISLKDFYLEGMFLLLK